MENSYQKTIVGWRETALLPEICEDSFPVKIDTGARTTAIHADNIKIYKINDLPWVQFTHDHHKIENVVECVFPVHHIRPIKNTSGIPEDRAVIVTTLKIGENSAKVEISLSDRADMKFPMIIGRTALRQLRLTVDPSRSWLQSPKPLPRKETK